MPDVFVSYKRENEAKVAKLVAALESRGLDAWWDREIEPGAPWEATIERQLREAKAVIVCWSKAAVESENVRSEARLARGGGRLIQVFLEPCEPPLFFGERQGLDLSSWRGKADDPRILKLAAAARAVAKGKLTELPVTPGKPKPWMRRRAFIAAALALMLLAATSWFLLRPGVQTGPTTLAVLPFRALSAADANLSEAIADDTRSAIGRNPNLRVLGRLAVTALAQQGLTPQDFRKRVGADYLLDGSVQRDGQLLRIKVSLVRAKDAAEVWTDQLDGKVDDVFAFQGRIAREVEGRIRGRLAPNEGKRAENITTSGEVYAIYADARASIAKRNGVGGKQGIVLLKKALAMDPNFAPAWAELGVVTRLQGASPDKPIDKVVEEATGYEMRALALAPNLGFSHAALAMVQGSPPELQAEAERGVALDPNNAEAWMWLGNMFNAQNKMQAAVSAYRRANEIDPLFITPVPNMIGAMTSLGDRKGIAELLARIDRTGETIVAQKARFFVALDSGHPGEALRLALKLRAEHPDEAPYLDSRSRRTLMQLGFLEEGKKVLHITDPQFVPIYEGYVPSAAEFREGFERPIDIWLDEDGPMLWARGMLKKGRTKEFVGFYDAAFKSPEDFYNLSSSGNKGMFRAFAPNVAALLRAAGRTTDADEILERDEQVIAGFLRNGPPTDYYVDLAQLRGAEGRDDQVVPLLSKALATGWLPDRQFTAVDIADEPCFARLVGRADFQALRKRILARIEEERRIAAPAVAAAKF